MQSRPTESFNGASHSSDTFETSSATQHGQRRTPRSPDPAALRLGLATGAERISETTHGRNSSGDRNRRVSDAATSARSYTADGDGVNIVYSNRRTPSPVDKIIEHERASPKFANLQDSPIGFRVISRSKNAPAPRLSLHDLPAEVLTHVLSYLPADSFSVMALVSRKIHQVVTEQHAWRMAFARFFLGHESVNEQTAVRRDRAGEELLRSEKRYFTRLTALSSWRSEYIIRTRLLRSLSKGSPSDVDQLVAKAGGRPSSKATRLSQIDYAIDLDCPVTRIEGAFETRNNRPHIRLIHSSDEDCRASLSNPLESRHVPWSFQSAFLQFYERTTAAAMYGLGAGEVVGVPNSVDVSPLFGLLVGDGSPGGRIYHRHLDEQRGNYLPRSVGDGAAELGMPKIDPMHESMTATWLAKTKNIPALTNGLIGALVGTSTGTVIACSLGTDGSAMNRTGPADVVARWVLSPGVPIIAFGVDENFSVRRRRQDRIWVFALNALGEVFYLKEFPEYSPQTPPKRPSSDWELQLKAWETGRSVFWHLVEPTRRKAKPDPFGESELDGSYSPRSSARSHGLAPEQISAETKEIEGFVRKQPIHFRTTCEGWDMQRRLEVDFSGDDLHGAGESVIVINCGLQEDSRASIQRFTRLMIEDVVHVPQTSPRGSPPPSSQLSLFGGAHAVLDETPVWDVKKPVNIKRLSRTSSEGTIPEERFEVWRQSNIVLGGLKNVQITASTRDNSTYANFTVDEDPLLSMNPVPTTWSPTASPIGRNSRFAQASDIPGQRARLFSVGTRIGTVLVWDMRAPTSSSNEIVNDIDPVSIIHTDSPGISSLAMTALYLVHGGSDGLVQAWDPLSSSREPIRTLHSKFTQRARRDLRQNLARPQGVGINFYAAGAICLDPNPKVLRGAVGIGNRVRYWSYSSSSADSYRGAKRRSQRDRMSNGQGNVDVKVTRTGRGALADYIANEQADLERARRARDKQVNRFNARFGANLLGEGATEDEIMAYATMISEESYASDNARRASLPSSVASSIAGSPGGSLDYHLPGLEEVHSPDAEISRALASDDNDLAEALRLSLQDAGSDSGVSFQAEQNDLGFKVRYQKDRRRKGSPKSKSPPSVGSIGSPAYASSSGFPEADDLEFALQISLAEEQSRLALEEQFPLMERPQAPRSIDFVEGKSKGKGKATG